ncbi:hypothetical protein F2Q68_00003173 [Brassica cretica]|uniref:Uncharacterized protein n=1 Tax=Brassica cretica TaxID=69181 RepID=A0A8S9JI59_BRACR|nr:hypothetical protein F2Q68_00003173 [Brassica cretica]
MDLENSQIAENNRMSGIRNFQTNHPHVGNIIRRSEDNWLSGSDVYRILSHRQSLTGHADLLADMASTPSELPSLDPFVLLLPLIAAGYTGAFLDLDIRTKNLRYPDPDSASADPTIYYPDLDSTPPDIRIFGSDPDRISDRIWISDKNHRPSYGSKIERDKSNTI